MLRADDGKGKSLGVAVDGGEVQGAAATAAAAAPSSSSSAAAAAPPPSAAFHPPEACSRSLRVVSTPLAGRAIALNKFNYYNSKKSSVFYLQTGELKHDSRGDLG